MNIDNDDFDFDHFVDMCIADDEYTPSRQSHLITESYSSDGLLTVGRPIVVDLWSCERVK